jgi:putative transposase
MKRPVTRYKRHRFPPQIIQHAVWLYHRFNLSHQDIEDLLARRGVAVSHESIRLWCNEFGPLYAQRLRRRHPGYGDTFFAAAKRFFGWLLARHAGEPRRIVSDKLGS